RAVLSWCRPGAPRHLQVFPTRRASDLPDAKRARERLAERVRAESTRPVVDAMLPKMVSFATRHAQPGTVEVVRAMMRETPPESRSEEHTSELQSRENLVCRLLLEAHNR